MSDQEILRWRKSSIITNRNLNTGLQCFIYMGGRLRLAFCLFKTLFFVNLSKFGCRFLCAQKRIPTSKTSCITLCIFISNACHPWIFLGFLHNFVTNVSSEYGQPSQETTSICVNISRVFKLSIMVTLFE